jgi:pimeloyl-ACP methyl ester carboxylesterase
MGGSVILAAARELGETVVGLVGVDTYQDLEENFPEEQFNAFFQPFQDNFTEATKNFVRSMFPPDADSLLVEEISTDMSSAPVEVALGSFRGLYDFQPLPVLGVINVPIYGINSDMYPVNIEAGKRNAALFDIRYMKGYGHFLHHEDPGQFNAILEEILEEIFAE